MRTPEQLALLALSHALQTGDPDAQAVADDALEEAGVAWRGSGESALYGAILASRERSSNARSEMLRALCHIPDEDK